MAIRKEVETIVDRFVGILKDEIDIESVYLFGSYVNGNYTKDSDIDIVVVSDDFKGDIIENRMKLMRLRRKVDNRIEPHAYNIKDFQSLDPFVQEIKQKGLKIM